LGAPAFNIFGTESTVKSHTYQSTYGDPRVADGNRKTFSQFVGTLNISRIDYGFYFKVFLSLFAAIALSLLSNLYTKKDMPKESVAFDRLMFLAVGLGCLVANIVIPLSARG
jgi:hypothetical protein